MIYAAHRTLQPGQTWHDRWKSAALTRKIVSVTSDLRVEWRRPGSISTRWCDERQFQQWIIDTQATVT